MEPVDSHQEDSFPPNYGPNSLLLSNTTESPLITKDDIETGNFVPGFINYGGGRDDNSDSERRSLQIFDHKSQSITSMMMPASTEIGYRDSSSHYSWLQPQYPRYSWNPSFIGVEVPSSGRMNNNRVKPFASGLTRQSSSPPGLFPDITASNGYTILNGLGSYRLERVMDGELSPSANRLKNKNNFSSGPPSLGILPRISELGREDFRAHGLNDTKCGVTKLDDRLEGHGFLFDPWNEPDSHFSQNFMGLKKETENGLKEYFDSQNGDVGHHISLISHPLSSSKTSSGMVALHFQDSVPCKIRAKRGCATHPRSIAERMRRTRISERMRKLHEFVPNMDKTNMADMLDLAVEYIMNLQKQLKILSEHRANCECVRMEKTHTES